MAVRHVADQPHALAAATPKPGHGGIGAGLIDEDQACAIKQLLRAFPTLPCRRDVGASLLAGVDAFF